MRHYLLTPLKTTSLDDTVSIQVETIIVTTFRVFEYLQRRHLPPVILALFINTAGRSILHRLLKAMLSAIFVWEADNCTVLDKDCMGNDR